ncbi:MAG: hypothetical protein ACT6RL_05015 [Neoaquamicrobium sediminum]|uniref:hypothetical protein n=1 Tax=Neoaquamicrobium sediminum TaxID=1849104 RepID=UPI00403686B6
MTLFVHVGGNAAQTETPCHSLDEWAALLDANERGDVAAIMRLIARPPKMLPTASLRPFAAASASDGLSEFALRFWERQGTTGQKK